MSKRAEEAAFKAYPPRSDVIEAGYLKDKDDIRKIYAKGYRKAEKDTIERAINWLEANADKYIVDLTPTYPDASQNLVIGGKCWDDFLKAMKN